MYVVLQAAAITVVTNHLTSGKTLGTDPSAAPPPQRLVALIYTIVAAQWGDQ